MAIPLQPQARELLEGILKPSNVLPTLEGVRAPRPEVTELLVGEGEPVELVWDTALQMQGSQVGLRWYQPYKDMPRLLTIFVHGGGWVNGTLASYDALCRSLALRSNGLVISVAYSLSPEARFEQSLNEVVEVFSNAASLAKEIGFEGSIAVAGDSAGGHLVAVALDELARRGESMPSKAVLIYPVTDVSMQHDSWEELGSGYNLDAVRMRWYWEQLTGEPWEILASQDRPELSPLRSISLAKFPPTMVITASHDPLRSEGEAFATALIDNGVKVTYLEAAGQIHGFLRFRRALTDSAWGADSVMARIGQYLAE